MRKWVISDADKVRYDDMFEKADTDKDGFVSGAEIKGIFLKSGLAQPVLAHIWYNWPFYFNCHQQYYAAFE